MDNMVALDIIVSNSEGAPLFRSKSKIIGISAETAQLATYLILDTKIQEKDYDLLEKQLVDACHPNKGDCSQRDNLSLLRLHKSRILTQMSYHKEFVPGVCSTVRLLDSASTILKQ